MTPRGRTHGADVQPEQETGECVMPHVDLEVITLLEGKHDTRDEGVCLLEAVAWFAGEKHTDHPLCVSSVLGDFGRQLNDALPDDLRQRLVPLVPRMVGTVGDGLDETRGYLALDWLIRTNTPAWLDLAGLSVEAETLRSMPPITDIDAAEASKPVVDAARDATRAQQLLSESLLESLLWVDVWDAASRAISNAAADAARSVALIDTPRDAARFAAVNAARAAAWDAVQNAPGAAASDATQDALQPTVRTLQVSAVDLLDRMIDGRWAA